MTEVLRIVFRIESKNYFIKRLLRILAYIKKKIKNFNRKRRTVGIWKQHAGADGDGPNFRIGGYSLQYFEIYQSIVQKCDCWTNSHTRYFMYL